MIKGGTSAGVGATAWAELCAAVQEVLVPALPWSPDKAAASLMAKGVLLPAFLQQATLQQLALVCTYVTQAGLGSREVWARVRDELLKRAPKGEGGASAGGVDEDAAADVAAVVYTLELGGCPAPEAQPWLQQLLGGEVQPRGSGPLLGYLSALQLLWCAKAAGCLAEVAQSAPLAAALEDPTHLPLLLPAQLSQLVQLWRELGQRPPEPFSHALLEQLLARQSDVSSNGSGRVSSTVAVWAVAYCLPGSTVAGALRNIARKLAETGVQAFADSAKGSKPGGAATAGGGKAAVLTAEDVCAFVAAVGQLDCDLDDQELAMLVTWLRGSPPGQRRRRIEQLPSERQVQVGKHRAYGTAGTALVP
jgi:hypothetical protein